MHHQQGGIPFRSPVRLRHHRTDYQTVAVFHQHVTAETPGFGWYGKG